MHKDKNQEARPITPTEQNNIKPTKILKPADQERVNRWKERVKKEVTTVSFKHVKTEDKNVYIERELPEGLTEDQQYELERSTMCAATGSTSALYGILLFNQIPSACFLPEDINRRIELINAIYATLVARAPADEYEGELIARLIVLHNQYMNFMGRAAGSTQTPVGVDLNINRATKLMRIYNETLEALNRYRRKGEQKVTVQHVNVNDGGQAIVSGNISTGGGDNAKK